MHMKVKIRKMKMTNLAMHVKAPSSRSDIRCNLDFFQSSRFQGCGGKYKVRRRNIWKITIYDCCRSQWT